MTGTTQPMTYNHFISLPSVTNATASTVCRYRPGQGQRSEVKGQRSEVRGQRSGVRGQCPATRQVQIWNGWQVQVWSGWQVCTPVCRLCGRYLAILGRPIRVTVPAVTVAPTALVGSLIRSSNLPHSLKRGVHMYICTYLEWQTLQVWKGWVQRSV